MSKSATYENYRVTIDPRRLGYFGSGSVSVADWLVSQNEVDRQRLYRERCEEIAADVKRHVDNVGHVSVEFDTVATCSHCGAAWTEESETYNGGCCEEDEKANPTGEAS